ncbi:UNVERIFIED_CONTAM: Pentatricopeptide repeat-containing protein, mitochondrial [Sesamum latifolium]|uniref:Pentatricopeptide repeat-containing protein, mitochondrial n=1 Tax=Sesamum latifolium TaxID=2727402 RepID=A0AAW2TQ94_9LAMI
MDKLTRERSDLSGMEKLLDEIEAQQDISIDWATYSIVAYQFHKSKREGESGNIHEEVRREGWYNHLISHYAHLGYKDEMLRIWGLQKISKKQINQDYITMLGSLVKLGELETAEAVLKEWDSSCCTYNFEVPNILLTGYCQKGLVQKSETMLRNIVERGKKPTPDSWAIIAAGYLDQNDLEKAFQCMKEALAVKENNKKWMPKRGQIKKNITMAW